MPYSLSDLQLIDNSNGMSTFQYPDGQTLTVPTPSDNFMTRWNAAQVPAPMPEPTPTALPSPVTITPDAVYDVPTSPMIRSDASPMIAPIPTGKKNFTNIPMPTSPAPTPFNYAPSSYAPMIREGYKNRIYGMEGVANVDAAGQERAASISDEALGNVAKMNLDYQAQQEWLNKATDDFMAKQQESQNVIKNMKVDPSRKFKSLGTWGKIGAAIAIMANEIGNSMSGKKGPNESLNIILKSVDDDIAQQENEIEKAKGDLNADTNMLSRYLSIYQDRLAAKKALRADYIDMVNMRLDNLGKRVSSEKAKYGIQATKGELQVAQAKDLQDAEKAHVQNKATEFEMLSKLNQKPEAGAAMSGLAQAEKGIQELKGKGMARPDRVPLLKLEDDRMVEAAQNRFILDYLAARKLRNTKENQQMVKSAFLPSAWDSEAVVKQKEAARQDAIRSLGLGTPSKSYDTELPESEGW